MIEPLQGFLVERVWEFLPRFLARRLAPLPDLARGVRIDLRPNVPIEFQFGTPVPYVGICFRITNLNNISLKLDRLTYGVWVGQPLADGQCVDKQEVPLRDLAEVYVKATLNEKQQAQVCSQAHEKVLDCVTINVTAYFHSKAGEFQVKAQIEHREVFCRSIRPAG